MKRLTLASVGVCFLLLGIGLYFVLQRPPAGSVTSLIEGYNDSEHLASDVKLLPAIGIHNTETTVQEWERYVLIARRVKKTRLDIIKSALKQVSTDSKPIDFSAQKTMLLLRVCFECPAGKMQTGIHGGWVSYSAIQAKKHIQDMNWPVMRKSGRFYLEDTLDGYLGKPYDAVAEFEWMLANCQWRKL